MNFIRRATAVLMVIFMLILSSACRNTVQPPKEEPLKKPNDSFLKYGETNEAIIELSKINNSVWVHTSYHEENGALVSTNGLLVVTDTGLVLIDTPWTEKQLDSLVKLIREEFNGKLKEAVITHVDPVAIKSATYLKKNSIPVYSLENVAKAAEKEGVALAGQVSKGDLAELKIDDNDFELYYPGQSYTTENSVVWIEKYKLLYAGDLIVEYGASSLGHGEANKASWSAAIEAIKEKYTGIEVVIPGQGQWGDTSLIDYTLELLSE